MFSGFKSRFSFIGVTSCCVMFVVCVLVAAQASIANAQTGKDTMLWEWTPRGEHHNAIVRVLSGGGSGTGVIVKVDRNKPVSNGFEGWCLSAWHVVSDDNDTLRLWDVNGGMTTVVIHQDAGIYAVRWNSAGHRLATINYSGFVSIYDATIGFRDSSDVEGLFQKTISDNNSIR